MNYIFFVFVSLLFTSIADAKPKKKKVEESSCSACSRPTTPALPNIEKIEEIFGKKGTFFADEGVLRFNFARTDVPVSIAGWPLDPFMGVSTWFAFQKGKKPGIEVMMMGNLVLREYEVQAAMKAAVHHEIQITALHNHLYFDEPVQEPELCFMHIEAEGGTDAIAKGCLAIFDAAKSARPMPMLTPAKKHAIDGEALEKIFGLGFSHNGMFKVVVGRQTHAGCGCPIGSAMGVNSWAAFDGTMDNCIINGDLCVTEAELQPALKQLLDANLFVAAIHNRMINENPRMMYIHFWGHGAAVPLAQGFKNALDRTAVTVK